MIRSRDIILFLLVLWFLLLAIMGTVWQDTSPREIEGIATEEWIPQSASTSETKYQAVVSATATELSHTATIARLQEKIAAGNVISNPTPSVERPAAATADTTTEIVGTSVQRCTYADDTLGYISRWPVLTIQSELREGAHLYYTDTEVSTDTPSATTSTSTTSEVVRKTWLQLPQFPQPLPTPSCLPSEMIGVHTNGTLLFNHDAASYRNLDADTLIGYARDGYPIYGRYEGELDACGGYQHPTGYRYAVHSTADTFLQCFTASPQSIQW